MVVFAPKKVCSDDATSIINLTWIAGEEEQDFLLIEAPCDDNGRSNLFLLSKIRGTLLNHPNDPVVVGKATRDIQMLSLSLEGAYQCDGRDLGVITGCCHRKTTIRLVACDCDGKFVVFDYNILERVVSIVKRYNCK
jgi:hypothetical protein